MSLDFCLFVFQSIKMKLASDNDLVIVESYNKILKSFLSSIINCFSLFIYNQRHYNLVFYGVTIDGLSVVSKLSQCKDSEL